MDPLSSNLSGLNKCRGVSGAGAAGSSVFESVGTEYNKSSGAKTPGSKTPDSPNSIVSNGRVADATSNSRIAGSVVICNASDSGMTSNCRGSVTRSTSKPNEDIYLTDNCIQDYYHERTDPCIYAMPVSDSESVDLQPSIAMVSSSAAAFSGSAEKCLSGAQDCDDYTEVFQREVVCGSISPDEMASCTDDEPLLQLDNQSAAGGIHQMSGSVDLDSGSVTQDERESSEGTPKTNGVDDADLMCGTHLLDSVEKDDEGLVSIVTGEYFEATDSLFVYVIVS